MNLFSFYPLEESCTVCLKGGVAQCEVGEDVGIDEDWFSAVKVNQFQERCLLIRRFRNLRVARQRLYEIE